MRGPTISVKLGPGPGFSGGGGVKVFCYTGYSNGSGNWVGHQFTKMNSHGQILVWTLSLVSIGNHLWWSSSQWRLKWTPSYLKSDARIEHALLASIALTTRKHSSRSWMCFGGHQISVPVETGCPQVNKFEQVSNDGHHMSLISKLLTLHLS